MDEAKSSFRRIFKQLSNRDKTDFLHWVAEEFDADDDDDDDDQPGKKGGGGGGGGGGGAGLSMRNAEAILRAAAEEIRMQVPIEAVLDSETVVAPGSRTDGAAVDAAAVDDATTNALWDKTRSF